MALSGLSDGLGQSWIEWQRFRCARSAREQWHANGLESCARQRDAMGRQEGGGARERSMCATMLRGGWAGQVCWIELEERVFSGRYERLKAATLGAGMWGVEGRASNARDHAGWSREMLRKTAGGFGRRAGDTVQRMEAGGSRSALGGQRGTTLLARTARASATRASVIWRWGMRGGEAPGRAVRGIRICNGGCHLVSERGEGRSLMILPVTRRVMDEQRGRGEGDLAIDGKLLVLAFEREGGRHRGTDPLQRSVWGRAGEGRSASARSNV